MTSATGAAPSSSRRCKRIWTEDEANLGRRLLPDPRLLTEAEAALVAGTAAPRDLPGRQLDRGAPNGGRLSDWYFSNGNTSTGSASSSRTCAQIAAAAGRTDGPRFGLNGFVIVRDTEQEARDTLREIIAKAHVEAVEGFGAAVKQAGQSTSDKHGMWADSSFEDLVQYNDGFRTQLIGTPEQVARRIVEYRGLGVDLILAGFLHYHEEVERFGRDVLPIVRELEVEAGLDRDAVPDPAAGLTETEHLAHVGA